MHRVEFRFRNHPRCANLASATVGSPGPSCHELVCISCKTRLATPAIVMVSPSTINASSGSHLTACSTASTYVPPFLLSSSYALVVRENPHSTCYRYHEPHAVVLVLVMLVRVAKMLVLKLLIKRKYADREYAGNDSRRSTYIYTSSDIESRDIALLTHHRLPFSNNRSSRARPIQPCLLLYYCAVQAVYP